MSPPTCWACGEEIRGEAAYCGHCGIPVEEFEVRGEGGFLSHEAIQYIEQVAEGRVSYPVDPSMDDALQEALNEQLRADLRDAYTHLGFVAVSAEAALSEAFQKESALEALAKETKDRGTAPDIGLIMFLDALIDLERVAEKIG